MKSILMTAALLILAMTTTAKKPEVFSIENYGVNNSGTTISLKFEKGKEHNHPLFAVWLADENGNYIQTLYVSQSIGRGIFVRANRRSGKWMGGEIQRPASLPYWAHQRAVKNQYGTFMPTPKLPIPDAYTGATPSASFVLHVTTEKPLNGKYRIMLELNQSWDWNESWTNNLYPADKEYKTSSQPALVYSADVDTNSSKVEYELKAVGHSHYSGADGSLNIDLSTMSTALKIAKKITAEVVLK